MRFSGYGFWGFLVRVFFFFFFFGGGGGGFRAFRAFWLGFFEAFGGVLKESIFFARGL